MAETTQNSRFSRRHWKDGLIAVLAVVVVLLGGLLAWERGLFAGAEDTADEDGDAVAVFDVVVDREARSYLDVLFDRPLGEGKVGDVLGTPPATLMPAMGGVWRWRDTNALRFEPTDRLPFATEIRIALIPDRLLGDEYHLAGDPELTVRTDPFLVEKVEAVEEPALEGRSQVFFRGNVRFNYPVDPEELAPKIRIEDPAAPEGTVAVELETGWQNQVVGFRSKPVQKQRQERTVTLVVDGTLTPAQGNVLLSAGAGGGDYRHEIPVGSSERLVVREVRVEPGEDQSRMRVELSSQVSAAVAARYVQVAALPGGEPVEIRLAGQRNVLTVHGPFAPGERYRLTLEEGLPARDEAVLQETSATDLPVPDLPAEVDFESDGMFLPKSGHETVALTAVNSPKAELTIDRVYRNNLFFLLRYRGYSYQERGYVGRWFDRSLGDRLAEDTLEVGGERNERVRFKLDLGERLEDESPGLYQVTIQRGGTPQGVQRWMLTTDLGVVAKKGVDGLDVWVSSFYDLDPVSGARVRLVSNQNQELAVATTDAAGRVRFGEAGADERLYFLTVEKGDDWSFLLFDRNRVDWTGQDVGGAPLSKEGYRAYLYGERDLYRPGETVEGVAVLRDAELSAPPSMPAVLKWRDPRGRLQGEQTVSTGPRGLAPFELDVPDYAVTGAHSLQMEVGGQTVGTYRFQVEEFVPDRIRVEVRRPPEAPARVGPGEELAFRVSSQYLFGPPAAELPVEARVRLVDATFAPAGFLGYVFRNVDRQVDDREILVEEGRLDDQGAATFRTTLPAGAQVPSTLDAVITARVREAGGRGVAARSVRRVDPYPYYLGLKPPEGYADPGEPVELAWVAVAPDGTETQAQPLRADLFRDRWNTVLRQTADGNYRYVTTRESELVESQPLPGGETRGTFEVVPPETGQYRVELVDPDTSASTAVTFYSSGWGYAPWALENPDRVELDLDREEYQPGQTARVQVRSPFPGKLLLTVERERLFWSTVVTLEGNTGVVDVPVREAYRPNAYVTATVIRSSRDLPPDSVGRAAGAIPLPVDRTSNRIPVTVEAPEEVRPETTLTVSVEARPGSAVTVAAVDEGILQLIAQETPDPFTAFYRKLALGVASYDLFSLLLPDVEPPPPAGGGLGAEGAAQSMRTEGLRRVQPVAFWSGVVEAGADGRARATFELPAFAGALRVMAVAVDGRRFGSAQAMVRVRDPLVLLPTTPRVLALEERAELPVTVRNDTGDDGEVTVRLRTTGPVTLDGESSRVVTLADGEQSTMYFPVVTGDETGSGSFAFRATGLGESTGLTEHVPIRPDLPEVSEGRVGSVTEAVTEIPLAAPERFRPETLRRELRIGPVPLVQLGTDLEDLLRYPYGCLEQTVSAAFPLIYMEELAKSLAPEILEDRDPKSWVDDAIRRAGAFQVSTGGFSLWPGGSTPHPWASLYATHFLLEAERAGFSVPPWVLEPALQWAASEARAKNQYGGSELERMIYALYVLARGGRADRGVMDFVVDKHLGELRSSSRALLAAAYAATGDPSAVADLAANIRDVERIERQTGKNFSSTRRNRAMLLLALLEVLPDDPRIPALADRLTRETRPRWGWTTQENGFTLLALGRLYQEQAEKPPYRGTVKLGGRAVGTFEGETRSFPGLEGPAPLTVEMAEPYESGSAFWSLTVRGVPTREAFQPRAAGLEVERTYRTRDGGTADLSNVRQGDLLVIETRVRSVSGPVDNVAVENLLPSGLEVENPRLETTETLPWISEPGVTPAYLDLRDDRIVMFLDLPGNTWQTTRALVRAVTPGTFRLPPAHAEAMYDPRLQATGPVGEVVVKVDR